MMWSHVMEVEDLDPIVYTCVCVSDLTHCNVIIYSHMNHLQLCLSNIVNVHVSKLSKPKFHFTMSGLN